MGDKKDPTEEQILVMKSMQLKLERIANVLGENNIDYIFYVGDSALVNADLLFILCRLQYILNILLSRPESVVIAPLIVECQDLCDKMMGGRPTAVKDSLDHRYRTAQHNEIIAKQIEHLLNGLKSDGDDDPPSATANSPKAPTPVPVS